MTETGKHVLTQNPYNLIWNSINPEEKVLYGMMNDYMFRAVLQRSPAALRGLLSALLHIPESEIISCEICNPIILGDALDEKTCILDILVLLNKNRQINLEMQVGPIENWTDRSLYYLCKMFTDLKEGMDYTQTKPSIHIGILSKSPVPEDAAFYNEYSLKNRKTGYEFTGKFSLHVLDLSYISKVTDDVKNSSLYHWACLFKATTWKEMLAMAEQSESIKKAVVTLRQLTNDEKIPTADQIFLIPRWGLSYFQWSSQSFSANVTQIFILPSSFSTSVFPSRSFVNSLIFFFKLYVFFPAGQANSTTA